jgi:hypothetical protein
MVRLSSENRMLAFYFGGMFGLSFWIGGILLHYLKLENIDLYIWPLYSLAFLSLSFAHTDMQKLICLGVVFIFYALLMHIYISKWQHESPLESIANIFSIRSIILTLTLGIGELLAGKLSNLISLSTELYLRSFVALSFFCIFLYFRKENAAK